LNFPTGLVHLVDFSPAAFRGKATTLRDAGGVVMTFCQCLCCSALTLILPTVSLCIPRSHGIDSDDNVPPLLRSANEFAVEEENRVPLTRVTVLAPDQLPIKDKKYQEAYADAFSILSKDATCARFFGGLTPALEALNGIASRMTKGYFPETVGMRMSGDYVIFANAVTKKTYRVFNEMSVNWNGPFYRHRSAFSQSEGMKIGRFHPNTREARALMLLHEVGHLIRGHDGQWLLPNDGHNRAQSEVNNRTIGKHCWPELRELSGNR